MQAQNSLHIFKFEIKDNNSWDIHALHIYIVYAMNNLKKNISVMNLYSKTRDSIVLLFN